MDRRSIKYIFVLFYLIILNYTKRFPKIFILKTNRPISKENTCTQERKTRHLEQYISPTQFTFHNRPLTKGIQRRIKLTNPRESFAQTDHPSLVN